MSVVIIGGNECMERRYADFCSGCGYDAKVFCRYRGGMAERIGSPDLMILFTRWTLPPRGRRWSGRTRVPWRRSGGFSRRADRGCLSGLFGGAGRAGSAGRQIAEKSAAAETI